MRIGHRESSSTRHGAADARTDEPTNRRTDLRPTTHRRFGLATPAPGSHPAGPPAQHADGVAEVDGDEGRLRVTGHATLEGVVERLPGRDLGAKERPLRVSPQLVPPFVLWRGRLPERLRIADVDGDRHPEGACFLEQRIQSYVVDGQQVPAVRRRVPEAEALRDLEAARAEALRLDELLGHELAVVVGARPHEPEVGVRE